MFQAEAREQKQPDTTVEEIDLDAIFHLLWERRRFLCFFSIGSALLALVIVLLLNDRFTATAIALPPSQNSSSSAATLLSQAGGGFLASSFGAKTQGDQMVSMLRTQTVEDAVINRFGLRERYHVKKLSQARKKLESRSTITLGSKDGLVTIEVTDLDPQMAADITNAYLEAYQKLSSRIAVTEASQRRIFFEQQLLEAKENLARAETRMREAEKTTGILQIEGQTRALIESTAQLRAQVMAKEVQLQSLRSFATEDNPDVIRAHQELDALQEQLTRIGGSSQDALQLAPKGSTTAAGMEYINRLRDVRYYEAISELIAKQYEIARQDEARQGTGMQIVERATAPDTKSSPQRILAVALAFLTGFFIASGWCLLSPRLPRLSDIRSEPIAVEQAPSDSLKG